MLGLISVGGQIAAHRKRLKLSQAELSRQAGISRATLDALENGRAGELGFSKVTKLLAALGLELTLQTASSQALENGRAGELGFSKVTKLLAALGLELTLQTASSQRPTLDELMQEDRDDKSLDRRR